MKKSRLLIVLAGLAVFASGCGYSTGGEDSTSFIDIEDFPHDSLQNSFSDICTFPGFSDLKGILKDIFPPCYGGTCLCRYNLCKLVNLFHDLTRF